MDFKKIYTELDSQFKLSAEKRLKGGGLVGLMQRACIPVIIQALKLYHEQLAQEKRE
jgi:hypothetical protein